MIIVILKSYITSISTLWVTIFLVIKNKYNSKNKLLKVMRLNSKIYQTIKSNCMNVH